VLDGRSGSCSVSRGIRFKLISILTGIDVCSGSLSKFHVAEVGDEDSCSVTKAALILLERNRASAGTGKRVSPKIDRQQYE